MHIPDGVLSPEVCVATGAISAVAVGYSLHRLNDSLADRIVPMTGMVGALIFAGQMVNFPLAVVPVSGHLIGGVLAAALLGPWGGCIALTVVLIVQRFLFADGGLFPLGANILHMGVIGSIGGYYVYSAVRRMLGTDRRGTLIAVAVASWLSVMAAAALFCLEFRLSHGSADFDYASIFGWMVGLHALIGLGEATISVVAINFVYSHRPDLLLAPSTPTSIRAKIGPVVATGLVTALAIGAILAPFASSLPDGLDAVSERMGFAELAESSWSIFPDYDAIPVSLAGIAGTLCVFLVIVVAGKTLRPRGRLAEAERE